MSEPDLVYMLDTNTVSYAMRGTGNVAERLRARKPVELCMSALTLAELRFGAEHKGSARIHKAIDTFIRTVHVAPFDAAAAARFGTVAAVLVKLGMPIGDFDGLIAGHALSLDLVLVTNNTKHFARVKGLRTEDWL